MTQPQAQALEPPPGSEAVSAVAEHFFRHESGKLIATLTRIFGVEHLTLAEDVVQDALARALRTWPYYGIPRNPSAWITQVAKNLALDVVRREQRFRTKEGQIAALMEDRPSEAAAGDALFAEGEIKDDRLRMMFVCCHPVLPAEAQVALALRTLCGFSAGEIARAFLASEAAMAKRLTRAKQKLREAKIPFALPASEEWAQRLEGVLHTLYLLFNEGYKASAGQRLIRQELCDEAVRMAQLLAEHPAGNTPRTHALLALMLLNAARLSGRVDTDGNILRLQEQDRSAWDRSLIGRGLVHLAESAHGDELTEYHVEASIAACHCTAPDYKSTDWAQILALYDHLIEIDPSPVVALNRAVAVANVHGPEAGIRTVATMRGRHKLESYYLLYAVLGEWEAQLDHFEAAADYFRKSIALTATASEQLFLARRLRECEARIGEYSEGSGTTDNGIDGK